MATNIDKLASQYIANGGKYTEDQIREACQKIQDNVTKWYKSSDSLFDFGSDFSGMSEDSFIEMMRNATSSGSDLDEYFSVLYDVMNSDGVDGLSRSEIDALFDTSGKDSISSFSIYHHMSLSNNLGEDEEGGTDIDNPSDGDGTTGDVGDTTGDTGDIGGTTGDDGSSGDPSSTPASTASKPSDFADMSNWTEVSNYIKSFLIDGNDQMDQPSEIIDYLYENGTISEDEAEYARQALIYGSQDTNMQTRIREYIEDGNTFDNAIQKLRIDINESDLYKTAEELQKATGTSTANSTADVDIDACVEQLYKSMYGAGTDEKLLRSILFDENISDEDFVQIVKKFEEKYGLYGDWGDDTNRGLVTRIEKETSDNLQSELTAQLAQRLINAAEAGDEDAIDLLCAETYSGTVGQNCTANDFLETVFSDSVSDSVIKKINDSYNSVVSDIPGGSSKTKGSLYEDIRTEYNGIFAIGTLFGRSYGSGAELLAKIEKASRYNY